MHALEHQVEWRQKLKQRADGKSQLDEMGVLFLTVDYACNLWNTFLYYIPLTMTILAEVGDKIRFRSITEVTRLMCDV